MLDYVYLQTFGLLEICLGDNAKTEQFENVSKFYNLNSELLQYDYRFLETIS